MRKHRIAKLFFFVLPLFVVFLGLLVWAVNGLWNWLMPEIFGLRAITYWQAAGLMALSWILFRGFRGPRMSHGGFGRGMRERWSSMTDEERRAFRDAIRSRWQGAAPPGPEPETKA
jgi:hypothetical protein